MVPKASFDLAVCQWAEVRWKQARPDRPSKLGLRDLLVHAHEIEALAITPPPALSAVYRLLYAITARITDLDKNTEGFDDWLDRRSEIFGKPLNPERVDDYFNKYSGKFDLFHPERPFLQDPRLADPKVCPKGAGVNKLALGRPAGNNSVWFGHHWDASPVPVPTPEAFLALLCWLYYGPSGRCATRTHADVTAADVSAGPLRSSLSYHPEGNTLLETLLAGLPSPTDEFRQGDDPCPWELPDLPDPLAPPREPDPYPGPCARLTGGWQHALLLTPDETGQNVVDAHITWGRRNKQPPTGDAYVIFQVSKQGNIYARPADSGRALWRDLDGLLDLPNTTTAQPRRPAVFGGDIDDLGSFKVRALGFEQDGKTKDIQFVSAVTPPLLFRINETDPGTSRRIGDLRTAGELYGSRLDFAVKLAWASIVSDKPKKCAWSEHAAAAYWPMAEETFWRRMRDQDFDRPWRSFLGAAISAFEQVTQGHVRSARTARAIERARLELYGGVRKISRTKRRSTSPSSNDRQGSMAGQQTPTIHPALEQARQFVTGVFELCEDPGKRSALRSGLGRPLDECHRMHKVIAGRVPNKQENIQRAYYAIAAMIASLPPQARGRSSADNPVGRGFGQCLAEGVAHGVLRESTAESHLDLLTRQSVDGLHRHLPAMVRAVADRSSAVDWGQLLLDLQRWEEHRDQIARRWLQSFYRTRFEADLEAARAADDDDHDSQ
ncbi:CRISPR system Cascade subunit CasA [Sinosporangium album]|uniref:CRISPR system Cascade subunit CasA n=1 Tax=Sinosporangium album TaxID=504805 RepID=A0A1G7ZNJ2_9ACTN|nr:type I-E CRISPR-associated protein Cse1/CasA [Sinosporangium album]SDH09670.1 CRISPR system Cascade subunit CasA [Sinosporangium album]